MDYSTFELLRLPYSYQIFEANSPPSPNEIRDIQSAYKELAAYVDEILAKSTPSQTLMPMVQSISKTVDQHLEGCLRQGETVTPNIPTPTFAAVKEFYNRVDSAYGNRRNVDSNFAIQAFASLVFELRILWSEFPVPEIKVLAPNVVIELSSYAMWHAAEHTRRSGGDILGLQFLERKRLEVVESELSEFLNSQKHRIDQADIDFAGTLKKLEQSVQIFDHENDSAQVKLGNLRAMLAEVEDKAEELKRQIDESSVTLSGFDAELEERLKGVAMAGLWKIRAQASEKAFRYSAILITILIIVPPTYAITHIETVVDILQRVGNAAVEGIPEGATNTLLTVGTISRLVVITAPIALYFWAIKLLIRFNTRSMVLMDDARQRNTTMSTYYHLIKRNVISSKEERGLMLNALFRPLPGHGPENVEPPNFLEIMGKKSD